MKIFKRIIFSLIFVSFASASLAETKMRITLQLPLKAHLGQNLLVFKKELESRSDIKVEIYDSAQLYKDKEVPQAVGSGAIEAGVASITRFAGTNPEVDVFYLPFLFDSEQKVRKATQAGSEIRAILDPAIAKTGAVPLYYQAYGSAIMLSNGGPMKTPADFKDKKINFKSAVLYKKEKSNFKSDYIVHNLQDNPWIVFPYELRELISIEDLKKELK